MLKFNFLLYKNFDWFSFLILLKDLINNSKEIRLIPFFFKVVINFPVNPIELFEFREISFFNFIEMI